MTHPPHGWYPDPSGQNLYRRWDGEKWSDLTSNDPSSPEATSLDPLHSGEANATASFPGTFARTAPSFGPQADSLEDLFPSRPVSPATARRQHWRKALAWTLIAGALLIQLGAIGVLAIENFNLENLVVEQRNEIDTLKRQREEENQRREQEAQTQATAWCAGVSEENRLAVPELFMKYQRAGRLTQEATQNACADRVAIAHAVSVVDFSLLQSIAIDECSHVPGEDTALVRGTLALTGPSVGDHVAESLQTGDVWIDVALVGARSSSPAATTRVEAVSPGESRTWEVTLPFQGLSDIHSCRIHSVSWWPSNAS